MKKVLFVIGILFAQHSMADGLMDALRVDMNELWAYLGGAPSSTDKMSSGGGSEPSKKSTQGGDGQFGVDASVRATGSIKSQSSRANALPSGSKLKWPVGETEGGMPTYISSVFGEREVGTTSAKCGSDGVCYHIHQGIDIVTPEGTPVKETQGGVVTYIEPDCGKSSSWWKSAGESSNKKSGCYVTVYNPNTKLMSQYLHLSRAGTDLKVGDEVSAGAVIGYSGQTGDPSITPHLHFGVCDETGVRVKIGSSGCAGGKHIDPSDVLSPGDRRYRQLQAMSLAQKNFMACRHAAGRDKAAATKCRKRWRSEQAAIRSGKAIASSGPYDVKYTAIKDRTVTDRSKSVQ